ncbi:MAG: hypothetical protein RL701_253, partial [Pseudomonadota bacterium]
LLATALLSCSPDSDLPTHTAVIEEAIIGGKTSSAAQNAVVLLQIDDSATCTGTLVAPKLVLTARHCVSETDAELLCAADGSPVRGGRVGQDIDPERIIVYVGQRQSVLEARARGAQLVHGAADNLCNNDIAFLVLDRAVTDTPLAALRMRETTRVGELITSIGWGLTKQGELPKVRLQRRAVPILDVGPSPETPPHELLVGESICSGDSGGPALSDRGAIIGVVSSGGNGSFDEFRPELGCIGPDTTNIYTRVAPFSELVARAFTLAGATPLVED